MPINSIPVPLNPSKRALNNRRIRNHSSRHVNAKLRANLAHAFPNPNHARPFRARSVHRRGHADPRRVLVDSISTRIRKALNVNDAPAKALKPGRNGRRGYPDYKASHGLMPVRDWVWTGRTLRSLKVKSANENQAIIGFVNPNADRIAHANNLREKQFGVSPKDRNALNAAVLALLRQARAIRVRKAA